MVLESKTNFNNPVNIPITNSYSIISSTLDNPFVNKPIEYGNFGTADPVLNSMLPKIINLGENNGNLNDNNNKNINYGLTSPGFLDNAMSCSGLDYINTNPNIDKLPFQRCLNKFTKQWEIPEMVFNNLINNLPYTFGVLSIDEKKRYLTLLQKFIDEQKNSNNLDKKVNNKQNVEKFENSIKQIERMDNNYSSKYNLSYILFIILIIILIIIILIYFTNKNNIKNL